MESVFADAPLIEVRGITKRYGNFAVKDVSFTVEPGQVVGFVGKNGAGKSTTIKALLGLIHIDGGEALILGRDLRSAPPLARQEVGVVFDTVSLPSHLRVSEVEALMARAYPSWDSVGFVRHIEKFGLDGTKAIKDLSRGIGMKLSLACALAHNPRVLILDEATAGLDPMARDEVLDMLRTFVAVEDNEGRPRNAILMSSHITSDLEKIADEVVCIDGGRIVFDRAKDEITDCMGVARCRATEVQMLVEDRRMPNRLRTMRNDYGVDVLVPDRFDFARAYPHIPCDRMTIDEYMILMLKGEELVSGSDTLEEGGC